MKNKKTLILSGMGLNCEHETAYACEKSGATAVEILHTLRFLNGTINLGDYDFIIFIGGFLDGDYLGSARVGVNRFKYGSSENFDLKEQLKDFSRSGRLLLGICNGFQLLVKLGFLPDEKQAFENQTISLTQNQKGIFENRWVNLRVNPQNNNVFTRGIEQIYLPVRHGEGRIVVTDEKTQSDLVSNNQIAMFYADREGKTTGDYPHNPNGSWNNIAAISNEAGNILGMMPHPEAYNHYTNHPHWTRLQFAEENGEGLKLFKNAYQHLNQQ
ncbi:phosphoribosylformylglycinamidine synthase subunit PurQ [bacterium]|nr:phosphoribosylformylglycinamidine synthase subunit PurQ [bacterium]